MAYAAGAMASTNTIQTSPPILSLKAAVSLSKLAMKPALDVKNSKKCVNPVAAKETTTAKPAVMALVFLQLGYGQQENSASLQGLKDTLVSVSALELKYLQELAFGLLFGYCQKFRKLAIVLVVGGTVFGPVQGKLMSLKLSMA
jgi:hypothetical protein